MGWTSFVGGAIVILYVGPDQIIPLSTFIGTALGFALIYWNKLVQWVRKISQLLSSKME
jgi:hypothetical protein